MLCRQSFMKLKKSELKNIKTRKWNDTRRLYNHILLVPGKTKHSSGFMHQMLIGVFVKNKKEEYEILGYPDDIQWELGGGYMRTDCYYPQGIFRFWTQTERYGKFKVSESLSSMTISLVK